MVVGEPASRNVFVVSPDPQGGWQGTREGSERVVAQSSQKRAVVGHRIHGARRYVRAIVGIKGRDGTLQLEDLYGRNPVTARIAAQRVFAPNLTPPMPGGPSR